MNEIDKTREFNWTPKRELFVKLYPKALNASKAAEEAGYSKKSAEKIGHQLIHMPEIKAAIKKEVNERLWEAEVSVERVLKEAAVIAFRKPEDYIEISEGGSVVLKHFEEMPEGASRAIASIEEDRIIRQTPGSENRPGTDITVHDKLKYRFESKVKAIEMLMKYLGMFIENVNINGNLRMTHAVDIKTLRDAYNAINGRKKPGKS